MSREIKFRVWDCDKMEYFGEDDAWLALKFSFDHDGIAQQYTGLKDKNGKEIYEGDILSDYPGKRYSTNYIVGYGGVYGEDNDNFGLGYMPYQSNYQSMVIIGNIYENPELIEDSKHE